MKQTKTYTEKPPATARAANDAWDYFSAHYYGGKRKITELFYSPCIDHCYKGWICVYEIIDGDTDNWKFGHDCVTYEASSERIKTWAEARRYRGV